MAKKAAKEVSAEPAKETKTAAVAKYILLHQLNIVKAYIDNKFRTLLETLVVSDSGIHGLRYKDGKLQRQDESGNWVDIVIEGTGGGTVGEDVLIDSDIASDSEVADIFK